MNRQDRAAFVRLQNRSVTISVSNTRPMSAQDREQFHELHNRLMGPSDIAAEFEVSRATVSNWIARHASFPMPVYPSLYARDEVYPWVAEHFATRSSNGPGTKGQKVGRS